MSYNQTQLTIMEGLRTFPANPTNPKKSKKPTPNTIFKSNCVETFNEPVLEGWTQVEAPYGGVYASGILFTNNFRDNFSEPELLPKRHFLTLESAIEFAERFKLCEAITKTTTGYQLRVIRCAIKNPRTTSFNTGLRTWLRDTPYGHNIKYSSLPNGDLAHNLIKTPTHTKATKEAKKIVEDIKIEIEKQIKRTEIYNKMIEIEDIADAEDYKLKWNL